MTLARVKAAIAEAALRAGRQPAEIRLVAISKSRPVEALRALYDQGHRDFGENRAPELHAKMQAMPWDVRWHFVGNLQRNKVKLLRDVLPLVHSFDRLDLLDAWPTDVKVLLQVNVAGEAQKNGIAPTDVEGALAALDKAGIACVGLSTMPPLVDDPELNRPHFRALREMRERLARQWPELRELSMGTTADYLVAVEEGATMVRVGRALFG